MIQCSTSDGMERTGGGEGASVSRSKKSFQYIIHRVGCEWEGCSFTGSIGVQFNSGRLISEII